MEEFRESWSKEVGRQINRWVDGDVEDYFSIRPYLNSGDYGLPFLLTGRMTLFIGKYLSIWKGLPLPGLQNTEIPTSTNSYALVVTFNPTQAMIKNVSILLGQFFHVVIVDNSPNVDDLIFKNSALAGFTNYTLLFNQNRNGLSGAINIGLRYLCKCYSDGWIFWFDQDSKTSLKLLTEVNQILQCQSKIELSTSLYALNYSGSSCVTSSGEVFTVKEIITSGSFTRLENIRRIGLYIEELFIDSLDHEYSLRARRLGFSIKMLKAELMEHSLGESRVRRLPLGKNVTVTNHNPIRWFYFIRNFIFVSLEGLPSSFPFFLRHSISLVRNLFKVWVFEDRKSLKTLAVIRGLWCGLCLYLFGSRKK